jgi:hypothetical protein
MSTINMPSFTAEASLYRNSGHYRMAGIPHDLAGNGGVIPQLPIGFCMANCDHIQDDFLRSVCNLNCLDGGGGGGGGGGVGGQVCRPSCSPCRAVPGEPGRWKTCIKRNCDDYEVRCR